MVPPKEFAVAALIGAPVAALTRTIFGPRPWGVVVIFWAVIVPPFNAAGAIVGGNPLELPTPGMLSTTTAAPPWLFIVLFIEDCRALLVVFVVTKLLLLTTDKLLRIKSSPSMSRV